MGTRAKHVGGNLTYYDSATHERVLPVYPLVWMDDFLGAGGLATVPDSGSEENGFPWVKLAVQTGGTVLTAHVADGANGQFQLALDNTSEAQDAVLYFGDQRGFSVKHDAIFETRVRLSVLPTTGVTAVFGLAGDHNLAKDSVTEHAWFRAQASAAILAESDDTTNDNDDVATGVTVLATEWRTYRIDFTNLADVRFYIDGVAVGIGTTFDMSNLTDAEAVMQPYFSLDKASGTGVGTMLIDYVRVATNRAE